MSVRTIRVTLIQSALIKLEAMNALVMKALLSYLKMQMNALVI